MKPRWRTLAVLLIVSLPLVVAVALARAITSALWFQEVGQGDVYARIATARLLLAVGAGGLTAGFLLANARIVAARARARPHRRRSLMLVATAAAVLIGVVVGARAERHWQLLLLWLHSRHFGAVDPLHHTDIGFFVFSLPFLERVAALLLVVAVLGCALTLAFYAFSGDVGWRPLRIAPPARSHLAVLAGLVLLALGWRFHLDTFSIELQQGNPHGKQAFPGAHYIDAHVRLVGLRVLSYLAVVCALAIAASPFVALRGRVRAARLTALVPLLTLGVAAVVSQSWGPRLVQRFVVNPQALVRERPFLGHSISATRDAFGLDAVDVSSFPAHPRLTSADLRAGRRALGNVQLWDTSILRLRMHQLGSLAPYYRAYQPTLDATHVGRRARVTLIGERELDLNRVHAAGRGWANSRLAYTHGLGALRLSGTRVDRSGRPRYDNRAVPVRQPRIYYGQQQRRAPGWVVANTRRPEVDVPAANTTGPGYHYGGPGGIRLSSWLRRAAFAVRLRSLGLLVSKDITARSRLIMHRDVVDRLRTLAPFLQWDPRPAALVVGGRIVFLADGYTTSSMYPYAQRVALGGGANVSYARAAVMATVDAFSGRMHLYVADRADPILRAWSASFPSLFEPISRMPPELRPRLRYPPALFDAQAQLYELFHITNPDEFASQADAWFPPTSLSGPVEIAGDIRFDESDEDDLRHAVAPSYRFASPPGRRGARLLRSALYSPRRGQNLVATLDGWVDARGSPHLASRSLPRDRVTLGPAQISRLVFVTPRVSKALGLRNREVRDLGKSSLDSVSLGTPHVVFLSGGTLQIQTLYEGSNGRGLARMLGVTVYLNGRAGIGPTLAAAVRQALHLPPAIKLHRLPGRVLTGRQVRIGFRVTNGLRERVRIFSKKRGTALSEQVRLRNGSGEVQWLPRKAGHVRLRVYVDGLDGSTVVARTALTVRPAPRRRRRRTGGRGRGPVPRPTVKLGHLPRRALVGRRVRIPFRVTGAAGETLRLAAAGGNTLTWDLRVRTGRGTVEWVPRLPGQYRLSVVVHGLDRSTIEAGAKLRVAKATSQGSPQ